MLVHLGVLPAYDGIGITDQGGVVGVPFTVGSRDGEQASFQPDRLSVGLKERSLVQAEKACLVGRHPALLRRSSPTADVL